MFAGEGGRFLVQSEELRDILASDGGADLEGGADGGIPAEGVGKGGEEGGGVDVLLGEETIEQLIAGEFGDMGRGNPLTI